MHEDNYNKIRTQAKEIYEKYKTIYSPALKEYVSLTKEGFNHLIFKGNRIVRDKKSQIDRFQILPLGIKLIQLATTYQEFESNFSNPTVSSQGCKLIQYWGIIGIISDIKVKVVIRKVGNGKLHFWSIIPYWTTSKKRDLKFFRKQNSK